LFGREILPADLRPGWKSNPYHSYHTVENNATESSRENDAPQE